MGVSMKRKNRKAGMTDSERGRRGAITVEAVIVLPLYILVILFIINFLNISYLQLAIQQGLNNAGRTLSQYGYALDVAVGIETINSNQIDANVATVGPVVDTFQDMTGDIGELFQDFSFDKVSSILSKGKQLGDQVKTMTSALGSISGKDVVSYLLTSGAETGMSMLVEHTVDEYLTEMKVNRSMLDGGIRYRVCMDDETQDIVLIATYRYQSGMFSLFTDGIDMRQVVVIHPWIGGETQGIRQK